MMNLLDICLIAFIALASLTGALLGFARLALLFVLAASIWGSLRFQPGVALWLETHFNLDPDLTKIIAYAIVIIAALTLTAALGVLLKFFVKVTLGNWLNRLMGAAVGLALGTLVAALLIRGLEMIGGPEIQKLLDNSILAKPLLNLLEFSLSRLERNRN
jgi:uncharacterized membrane protein required for colicin V production